MIGLTLIMTFYSARDVRTFPCVQRLLTLIKRSPSIIFHRLPPAEFRSGCTKETLRNRLGSLLHEIYQTVRGGQFRLSIMGIRALIEQVMVQKVGDKGAFAKNLDAFQQSGYISLVQRDALNDILDVGHAAIHRAYEPKPKDIQIALDITEGVLAAIFVHADAAKQLSEKVPPRPKKIDPKAGR